MPTITVDLDPSSLEALKQQAKFQKVPVPRLVQEAVSRFLDDVGQSSNRRRLLDRLVEEKPFGNQDSLDWIQQERAAADADRR